MENSNKVTTMEILDEETKVIYLFSWIGCQRPSLKCQVSLPASEVSEVRLPLCHKSTKKQVSWIFQKFWGFPIQTVAAYVSLVTFPVLLFYGLFSSELAKQHRVERRTGGAAFLLFIDTDPSNKQIQFEKYTNTFWNMAQMQFVFGRKMVQHFFYL